MSWSDISPATDERLDELARSHGFHPLHVEDCRSDLQRAKVELGDGYLFVVLKLVILQENNELLIGDLAVFVGLNYVVTVHRTALPFLAQLRGRAAELRPDEVLYRVTDAVVDSYYPVLEEIEDRIDALEGEVLSQPQPEMLEQVADIRTSLLEARRVLANTRQVIYTLQRTDPPLIQRDLALFFRDIHDHLSRDLDTAGRERDRLAGLLDLYQSSVANQNNEATRLLTVLGTVALPALVISAYCGMSVRYPGPISSPFAFWVITGLILLITALLLWRLKRRGYFS